MRKFIDLSGRTFGRLTVLRRDFTKKSAWFCICECGAQKTLVGSNLRSGATKSCGCLRRDTLPIEIAKRHRAEAAKIKDKQPVRKQQKVEAQNRYRITDKAALAQAKRWAKKKNKIVCFTDEQFIDFRKLKCHKCEQEIPRTGVCFLLVDPKLDVCIENMVPTCGICKLIKPKENFDYIDFSKNVLRRFWKKTPMAAIARQRARKAIGRYECASCHELFREKHVQIDHINPVVEIAVGFVSLDEFAKRLYCDDTNLQILCKPCHTTKTNAENALRKKAKK